MGARMTLPEIRDRVLALRHRLLAPFPAEVRSNREHMKREADLVLEELQAIAVDLDQLALANA